MTYRGFYTFSFARLGLRAGAGCTLIVIIIIHFLNRERSILARAPLPQELYFWSTREPKGSRISVNGKIFDFEDSLVLLEVDRT